MKKNIIAWDLGATKCAAGIVEYDAANDSYFCKKETQLKLTNPSSLDDLIKQIEANLGLLFHDADAVCISGAGFYDGSPLIHANDYPYPMHFAQIAKDRQWPKF